MDNKTLFLFTSNEYVLLLPYLNYLDRSMMASTCKEAHQLFKPFLFPLHSCHKQLKEVFNAIDCIGCFVETFSPQVLEYAIKRICMYCEKPYKGKPNIHLRTYSHRTCLQKNTIRLSLLENCPKFYGLPNDFPIETTHIFNPATNRAYSYSIIVEKEHPALNPIHTWDGYRKSSEYYRDYFKLVVLTSFRKEHLKTFILKRFGVEVNPIFHPMHMCCGEFSNDEEVDNIKEKFFYVEKIWKHYGIDEENDFKLFLTTCFLTTKHYNVEKGFMNFLTQNLNLTNYVASKVLSMLKSKDDDTEKRY